MRLFTIPILLFTLTIFAQNTKKYDTFFEKGNGNQAADYHETIKYYTLLSQDFPTVQMQEMGLTDSGYPLHMITFNPDAAFDFNAIQKNKAVLLVNNGIHAGEPDGIDATMQLFRDLALGKIKAPKNTVIVTIPVYNIGGALNRNSTTRANQDGPEIYGFRGNARNYDLNRDLIKSDTRNTKSFVEIFQKTNPDVFIDNHVSNGSDYQYKLTYIMTQHNKLGTVLGDFMNTEMMPALVKDLQNKKIETTPYVDSFKDTPDKGFGQFTDSPRYTTGYTSLFNTIGFVVETHMLKKYADRVKVTYEYMKSTIDFMEANYLKIKQLRAKNEAQYLPKKSYTLKWEMDSTKTTKFSFLGYEAGYKKSDATTGDRLYYDRSKPYKKDVPYIKEFKSVKEVVIPTAYIIPRGYWNIIDLLKNNGIAYSQLKNDTIVEVESYKIADFKTAPSAYEGHYIHRNTTITSKIVKVAFAKGDYLVPTNQKGAKYLLEAFEPEGVDSFFNWNFFDAILQQKEHYSEYVFEDTAAKLLKENPQLKAELESKKQNDATFAKSPEAQLEWIYKHSAYYEKAHLQYPVYRVL
ncbi:M14 family metallopeptidase [Flavobacterium sp. Fl-318]|uniref:M14 family metallopeptidase n=1 Tax=Flavobacterium cupriresistens TaxID=2893885 RepID=A0ABU4RB04_9FLAO|nr:MULTISPECIES: M14 family metallopeptidase [unclassified Flavobacterium]MDX6189754.1 M14 family metallopeptidase [Flavobacterium sp. Fl-318]UFH40839.1 M14 family metallopeptidase [Flavobacterium sp. F-323]